MKKKVQNGDGGKKKMDGKKLAVKKGVKNGTGKASESTPKTKKEQKELKTQRKQKKLADNYSLSLNIKKIWETLRK